MRDLISRLVEASIIGGMFEFKLKRVFNFEKGGDVGKWKSRPPTSTSYLLELSPQRQQVLFPKTFSLRFSTLLVMTGVQAKCSSVIHSPSRDLVSSQSDDSYNN